MGNAQRERGAGRRTARRPQAARRPPAPRPANSSNLGSQDRNTHLKLTANGLRAWEAAGEREGALGTAQQCTACAMLHNYRYTQVSVPRKVWRDPEAWGFQNPSLRCRAQQATPPERPGQSLLCRCVCPVLLRVAARCFSAARQGSSAGLSPGRSFELARLPTALITLSKAWTRAPACGSSCCSAT